ncbi:P-type conjugative transfer protein TrbG [Caulobacter flavus]|jgi:type IV secretion system protein VirB9|uniref:P-type conjugative transfer protein TrbG n=1 Tax=Caulobacter flavus TaxID=1679497 RepID=A0A2N5CQ72_9CAUL|nr:P-type conjugative transfer protein TrbG [Caulobacter flavus]AYV46239.1 P-type conjugative transfer protein TrbG [Caulobacter flavus]PLR09959.1 P-type conjugative transfer protein TrbG [Caulobacter flavus]
MTGCRVSILAAAMLAAAGTAQAAPSTPKAAPSRAVANANAAARVQPQASTFQGAVQRYAWTEGGLYQVYAAPGRVTDLVLEAGETLAGAGPIAAGDTARWVIGDTESGEGEHRRVHVLVKPTLPGLATNLVINTNRRTYYLELRASAATYMASVAWSYPQDALIALKRAKAATAETTPALPQGAPVAPQAALAPSFAALNFDYQVSGDKVAWRPQQVFDDGRQVVLVFSGTVITGDLPPLFLVDDTGRAELVNYRLDGRRIIVDRLFDRAELRLGDKRKARRVRIERASGVGR